VNKIYITQEEELDQLSLVQGMLVLKDLNASFF